MRWGGVHEFIRVGECKGGGVKVLKTIIPEFVNGDGSGVLGKREYELAYRKGQAENVEDSEQFTDQLEYCREHNSSVRFGVGADVGE